MHTNNELSRPYKRLHNMHTNNTGKRQAYYANPDCIEQKLDIIL
jgi:hypothetical protein